METCTWRGLLGMGPRQGLRAELGVSGKAAAWHIPAAEQVLLGFPSWVGRTGGCQPHSGHQQQLLLPAFAPDPSKVLAAWEEHLLGAGRESCSLLPRVSVPAGPWPWGSGHKAGTCPFLVPSSSTAGGVPRHKARGRKEGGGCSCAEPSSDPQLLCGFLPAPHGLGRSGALSGRSIGPGNAGPSCFLPGLATTPCAGGKEMNKKLGEEFHSPTAASAQTLISGLPAASLPPCAHHLSQTGSARLKPC